MWFSFTRLAFPYFLILVLSLSQSRQFCKCLFQITVSSTVEHNKMMPMFIDVDFYQKCSLDLNWCDNILRFDMCCIFVLAYRKKTNSIQIQSFEGFSRNLML